MSDDLSALRQEILDIYGLRAYQVGMAPVPRHVRLWWGARKMLGITALLRRWHER